MGVVSFVSFLIKLFLLSNFWMSIVWSTLIWGIEFLKIFWFMLLSKLKLFCYWKKKKSCRLKFLRKFRDKEIFLYCKNILLLIIHVIFFHTGIRHTENTVNSQRSHWILFEKLFLPHANFQSTCPRKAQMFSRATVNQRLFPWKWGAECTVCSLAF